MNFQPILLETTNSQLDFIHLAKAVPELDPSIHATHPDFLHMGGESDSAIGISDIKKLVEWSSKKPIQAKVKVAFLPNAGDLTLHAQNALLKILEEPPVFTVIVLQVRNPNHLLATVRSRLRHLKLASPKGEEQFPEVDQLLSGTFLENSKLVEQLAQLPRPRLEQFLQELLQKVVRMDIPNNLKLQLAVNIKTFIQSIRSGGNQRLTLQALAISINQSLQFLPKLDE